MLGAPCASDIPRNTALLSFGQVSSIAFFLFVCFFLVTLILWQTIRRQQAPDDTFDRVSTRFLVSYYDERLYKNATTFGNDDNNNNKDDYDEDNCNDVDDDGHANGRKRYKNQERYNTNSHRCFCKEEKLSVSFPGANKYKEISEHTRSHREFGQVAAPY